MKERFNVCLLNDSFPPLIDGVANAVVNYAEIIEKYYGHSLVAVPEYPNTTDNYPYPVIRYKSIDTTKLVGYRAGIPFDPVMLHEVNYFKPDIIHTHCPIASAMLARTIRQSSGAPIIFTHHSKFDIEIRKAIEWNLLREAAKKILLNNIAACDDVWVVSRGAGENLRTIGYYGDYIVMENGVDFPKGRTSKESILTLKKELGINDETVFLFVGRMCWYKGIKLIFDGLKKAADEGFSYKMVLVGDSSEKSEIEGCAKSLGIYDNCIFTGSIYDRSLLRVYFTMADLFLFPSTFDTNGIVVREAAACGTGSVLLRGSCAAEGIDDMDTGILIDENIESMCSAIKYTCSNREEIYNLGSRAMDKIYISWEDSVKKAVDRYQIVYENNLAGIYTKKSEFKKEFIFSAFKELNESLEKVRDMQMNIKMKKSARLEKKHSTRGD